VLEKVGPDIGSSYIAAMDKVIRWGEPFFIYAFQPWRHRGCMGVGDDSNLHGCGLFLNLLGPETYVGIADSRIGINGPGGHCFIFIAHQFQRKGVQITEGTDCTELNKR